MVLIDETVSIVESLVEVLREYLIFYLLHLVLLRIYDALDEITVPSVK
jgi:hypothetical protein